MNHFKIYIFIVVTTETLYSKKTYIHVFDCIKRNISYKKLEYIQVQLEEYDSRELKVNKEFTDINTSSPENYLKSFLCLSLNYESSISVTVITTKFIHNSVDKFNIDHETAINILEIEFNSPAYTFNLRNPGSGRKQLYISFSSSHVVVEKISSKYPMVIQGCEWVIDIGKTNASMGGYMFNRKLNLIPLVTSKSNFKSHRIQITERVVNLVNKLQKQVVQMDSFVQAMVRNEKIMSDLKLENEIDNMKYLVEGYKRFCAIAGYEKVEKVYFTYSLDFRGRIYIPGLISPTGDKCLRRCLRFNKKTRTVILDATASILQILGVILNNSDLMRITNIYTNECVNTWDEITLFILESDDDSELDLSLIDRKMVKFTVMRMIYGSNIFTIAKDFRENGNPKTTTKHIDFILKSFKKKFGSEYDMIELVREVNSLKIKYSGNGIDISNGYIKYENSYYKTKENSMTFKDSKGNKHSVCWYQTLNNIDKRKSNNAIMANMFHCIDSNICLSILEKFSNLNKPIISIHDEFIVNKNDRDLLIESYNTEIVKYRTYIIDLFKDNIRYFKTLDDRKDINKVINKMNNVVEIIEKRLKEAPSDSEIIDLRTSLQDDKEEKVSKI